MDAVSKGYTIKVEDGTVTIEAPTQYDCYRGVAFMKGDHHCAFIEPVQAADGRWLAIGHIY